MVTEVVSIASEKVTEMSSLTETEVAESDGEVEETVGAVVSGELELLVDSSLSSLQEKTVRLKRDMRIIYKTLFTFFLHQ